MAAALAPDLGDLARVEYAEAFFQAIARGTRYPLVLPYCILGPFILAPIYLAIPHTKRPWLYRSRWLVVSFVVAFDFNMFFTMSSMNVASAYASGLMGGWGILTTLNMLVWTHPQLEYARAIKAGKSHKRQKGANGSVKMPKDSISGSSGSTQDTRLRKSSPNSVSSEPSPDGHGEHQSPEDSGYIWQTFPETGSFAERLHWTFDLATNFRLIGWNRSITSVPRPEIPDGILDGDVVSLKGMPVISRSGYRRSLTKLEFVWTRIRNVAVMYVLLDVFATLMMKDPYFIYGPDRHLELPPFLRRVSPWLVLAYREIFTLGGIYAAAQAMFNLHDLFQYYVFSYLYPARAGLWQYTSIFGSFSQVLDRGLAGWWGSWWHQTFRAQFMAPGRYLVQHGYLCENTYLAQVTTMFVSFFQSGLLHAAGSISSMRTTQAWRAPSFFLLQPLGIIAQHFLNLAFDLLFPAAPRRFRQAFNLFSSLAWLQLTAAPFADDIASTGLWLLEPVPLSPMRWLGFGHPNDHWWRWNREVFPVWHVDDSWWKSGLQI